MLKVRLFSFFLALVCVGAAFSFSPTISRAVNVLSFTDLLSDSGPGLPSDHTFTFTPTVTIPPNGYFEFTTPPGFTLTATTTFSDRNVELYVNGVARLSAAGTGPGVDGVTLTSGSPGYIRYTMSPTTEVPANTEVEFRVGGHTSTALGEREVVTGTSSTTTIPADVSGITNATTSGVYTFNMVGVGGSEPLSTNFVIALVDKVTAGPLDTTEDIPPFRFGGAPTGTISGTSLNVEITLNTDEFSDCRFDVVPDTEYEVMPFSFNSSGLVVHSAIVSVTPGSLYVYYVRCRDDEDNYNTDDYQIAFSVNDTPTGNPNAEGEVEGDGTGTGNDGTGSGDGGGGTVGGTEGETSTTGQSAGGGGDGGGSGGGGGRRDNSNDPGGSFSGDGPYESGDGRVIISGAAFPGSTITALVDGSIAETTRADSDGSFSLTIDEIARGAYTFGIYATDRNDVKSTTFSTSFTVSGARASGLSNINLAPTIAIAPDPVPLGATAMMTGYAQPNAVVTLENRSEASAVSLKTFSATADASGVWSAEVSTTGFSAGTYQVRAKSAVEGGVSTLFSNWTYYGVGQAASAPINADLNRDGSVNLTDFSILLFWWGTAGGASNPPADINQDGTVSLTDFSIMLFNWTG